MQHSAEIQDLLWLDSEPELLFPVHIVRLADTADFNARLAEACERLADDPDTRRTHFVHDRFENLYPPRERLPEIEPLILTLERAARRILEHKDGFRIGFWLNRMAPGHATSRHSHEENDELLSAVYYIQVPENSGRLVFHDGPANLTVEPEAGMLLLFAPWLEHEVEIHRGQGTRLSVAFNLGPALSEIP